MIINYQAAVANWVAEVIGEEALYNHKERAFRFLEEALELVQACGVTPAEVDQLKDYTFNREIGEVPQEIAGSMHTLMALAECYGFDALQQLSRELERVSDPAIKAKIRAKAQAAPEGPLPQ